MEAEDMSDNSTVSRADEFQNAGDIQCTSANASEISWSVTHFYSRNQSGIPEILSESSDEESDNDIIRARNPCIRRRKDINYAECKDNSDNDSNFEVDSSNDSDSDSSFRKSFITKTVKKVKKTKVNISKQRSTCPILDETSVSQTEENVSTVVETITSGSQPLTTVNDTDRGSQPGDSTPIN